MTSLSLPSLDRTVPAAVLRWEGVMVCLAAWAVLMLIPLSSGSLALGWDALNHHIYLGWTAEQHRFDRDYLAAGYQWSQAPYLNWPVYRMAVDGWSGMAAACVLVTLHLLAVAPLWLLARACIRGATVFDVTMRALAVALALLSSVVVATLGSTMNDLLASAPLLWALAFAIEPAARGGEMSAKARRLLLLLSGLCAGLAVALKLSNAPFAILMPLLWWLAAGAWRERMRAAATGGAAMLGGFVLGYGHWGWLLWRHFGNPVYPLYDGWFAPVRSWVGWAG